MILSLTGPSGVGKTTLLHNVRKVFPDAQTMESITTRTPRPTDEPGEYRYVSFEEFDQIAKSGAFLWEAHTTTNRYGTRKEVVDRALASGFYIPILVIDAAEKLWEYAKAQGKEAEVQFIYIEIDDEEELRKRFIERGDTPEEREARIAECRSWNKLAHESKVPFFFLHATKTREEILHDALAVIRH